MDQLSRVARPPLAYRIAKVVPRTGPPAAVPGPRAWCGQSPDEGPVILAANHRSFMDSIFLALTSPRPVAFIAKAEYFDRPVSRWLFRSTGAIPLRRGSPAGARQTLAAASKVLDRGGTLGIYPEGTRSRDGRLHRGHPGPARLALATGAAIVPVGLIGTEEVPEPGRAAAPAFSDGRHPVWLGSEHVLGGRRGRQATAARRDR